MNPEARSGASGPAAECGAALAAAAAWRLLGVLFERPRPGWHAEVEALAREVTDADLRRAASAAAEAREADYLAVFGPGGAVSPREVSYRGCEDPGAILASLATFHEMFAFRPEREDPIDHLAVEASFAGYLLLKEAYAHARGDAEAAQTAAAGFAQFVNGHLCFLAEPLAARVQTSGAPTHLVLAAAALLGRTGPAPVAHRGPGDLKRDPEVFECDGTAGCEGCVPTPPSS
jgi:hypothetical protein